MCSMTLEGHRWLSRLSHLYNDTGCYEVYVMISSYTKVLISHIGQSTIYRWQTRSLLACQWISRMKFHNLEETRSVRAIFNLWLPIEFTWRPLK